MTAGRQKGHNRQKTQGLVAQAGNAQREMSDGGLNARGEK